MKARIISTNEIIDVEKREDRVGNIVYVYYYAQSGEPFQDYELEFLPEESKEVTIEGWVLRDDNNKIGIYRDKPTCDEDGWDLTGESYDLFPDITPVDEPKKVRITITPIDD